MAFPVDHFSVNENMQEDKRTFETPSMRDQRRERRLWLACQIAQIGTSEDGVKEGRWVTHKFRPAAQYVSDVEIGPSVTKATYEDVLPEEPTLSVREQEN
ncbi:uncharacterized protein PpBr36_10444 [Pyricularia pennisetigena]|uniref:uncharacterized protein n=1 Tax=Pyricularia pennisetigena TaxID=1578925 RepID=UPI00115046A9|nr:uncharacterized protein PpBr36_10444 [Pyricularia pennisetigena]TLS21142.1 hypothetical protein PpBr36_10444 [Pyricularia pennisetigena]